LVLDAITGVELFSVTHDKVIRHAEFSRDARYLLTTSDDHTARVWDASTGEPVSHPLQHNARIWDASFSPDGNQVVTAGEDSTARIWDWVAGDLAFPPLHVGGRSVEVRCVAYSPDGRRIATGDSNQRVRIWDALTGELLIEPIFHPGSVNGVAFSPDGTAIVSWSPAPFANVWNAETGERLLPPLRHQSWITWVEFSPDGRYLVTSSRDSTVRMWDATTGEAISIPLQTGGEVGHARFHPDGTRIVTASNIGGARVWTFTTAKWPVEDLDRMAHLLASHEVDWTLTRSVLPADLIVEAFRELRARYPDDFKPRADRRLEWHRHHALESMREKRWSAAAHHLTVLIAHHPEEGDLFRARGDARAELGHWELARQDFERQLEVEVGDCFNRKPCLEFLMVTLRLGDIDAARAHVARWFEEVMTMEDKGARKSAAYWAACYPGLWPDYIGQAEWAEKNSTSGLGLLVHYYRAGRYEDVIATFREGNLHVGVNPAPGYYHAMALHRFGETTRALEAVAAADRKHDQFLELGPVEGHRWYDLAYADFARAEAHALVNPASVTSLDP
jgi:tetratricopeptide (TPR) repeat protein